MKKKIAAGIGLIVALFLIFIALKSGEYTFSRSLVIKAPPAKIFPYINNSKKANQWMPWSESDPQIQMNYSGPDEGVGSKASWTSPGQMGVGEALIVESTKNSNVVTQITYNKPMEMSQLAEITLTPQGDSTLVRWSVAGKNNFLCRLFTFFMNMDKMVGQQFDKGLTNLQKLTE